MTSSEALSVLESLNFPIVKSIAEWRCPSCGASAYVFEISTGPFSPVVGVCMGAGHVWKIERGTHVGKEWEDKLKWKDR